MTEHQKYLMNALLEHNAKIEKTLEKLISDGYLLWDLQLKTNVEWDQHQFVTTIVHKPSNALITTLN